MPTLTYRPESGVDVRSTLGPMQNGPHDPTVRFAADGFWRATRLRSGTATVHIRPDGAAFEIEAWGDGADEVLGLVPGWLGARDTEPFETDHPLVAKLHRRHPRLRIGRSGDVMTALYVSVCGQKVTGLEARRAWQLMVKHFGEAAPGPADLRVAPAAERLAEVPYYDLHVIGLEKKRADLMRRVAVASRRLETVVDLPIEEAHDHLQRIAGIGPWTANEVAAVALGDTDAVSIGDFHLKNHVAWALARQARATDDEMLELLAPFAGHRARVIRLIGLSGLSAPRRGPRLAPSNIGRL
ncbi:MAG TPA: hypothetical protein VMW08_15900 [Acidimicrobiales bacterium]|nr:hypothetical protein [Acidimicrobiales bacterium]